MSRFACSTAVLVVLAVASPAFGATIQGSGQDSNDDGAAGANRDIVSTSFVSDDRGGIELSVTMAAPIDPQNGRLTAGWRLSETPSKECGRRSTQQEQTELQVQYDTNGQGHVYGPGPQPGTMTGKARIDGATLVFDLADASLAGKSYSCLDTTVSSTRGDAEGANTSSDFADRAAAAAPGFSFPGPTVSLLEEDKSVEVTDDGAVRVSFHSFGYDKATAVMTLRTRHKVRLTRSSPLRQATLGSDDVPLSLDGNKTRGSVRLTKKGLAFLKHNDRVGVVAEVVARDAQGRRSTTDFNMTLVAPPV